MKAPANKASPVAAEARYRRDLSFVVSQGAGVARTRFFRDLRSVALPVIAASLLTVFGYLSLIRAPVNDRLSATLVSLALLLIPLVTGALLTSLRRYELSGTAGTGIVLTAFAFAIALLSAARVPLSFSALAVCIAIDVLLMSYVLLRLQTGRNEHVALLEFDSSASVLARLGRNAVLVSDPAQAVQTYDYVLIDAVAHHGSTWVNYLTQCYMRGAEIVAWPLYMERSLGRVDVNSFDISHIIYSPSQILYSKLKRSIDLVMIVVTIPVWLPVFGIISLYVRLRAGSPVLFRQERRGHGGSSFTLFKFRTMAPGSENGATQNNDLRVVRGLGLLRRLRLDELPQLWNILRGEMSLVGPRPVSREIALTCEQIEPNYVNRVLVQPGLTGWAQVVSGYASNPHEEMEKLAYDLYYIKKMSLDLDLLILARTIRTVLFGTGAK